jgi:hypothetical protein
MNRAEQYTFHLCKKTFLSVWSYATPQGKNRKEQCDALIVCDPNVVIISVKDCALKDTGTPETDWQRWTRKAVDASIKQIYGAERWILQAKCVVRADGTNGLPFPEPGRIQVHRVAVALGSQGEVPISAGDVSKGYVHVLTEEALDAILTELDTVSDFVAYLTAKEKWLNSIERVIVTGGEHNLLAWYLLNDRVFPANADTFLIDDDFWNALEEKPEYQRKKAADKPSYMWDYIIEEFSKHALAGTLEIGDSLTEAERLVRTMARETRFQRRVLGKAFKEFMLRSKKGPQSRIVPSESGVVYVFLTATSDTERSQRIKELQARCIVARGLHTQCKTVIGICTEELDSGGRSFDGTYFEQEEWTEEHENVKRQLQDAGIFANPTPTPFLESEYPHEDAHDSKPTSNDGDDEGAE